MNNNQVRLTGTTFIRNKGEFVYLYNQVNYNERYYEKESSDFINTLSKTPRQFKDAINELMMLYDVDRNVLEEDYYEFVTDLEQDGFVVSGGTIEELNKKEPVFSYKNWTLKENNKEQTEHANISKKAETEIPLGINTNNELFIENLYLEITRHCNEHCVHCYIPEEQRQQGSFMALDDAKNYLDQAKETGTWLITITGGEAFLHPQINEIVQYARKKDFLIAILSNLTPFQKKHIPVLKENYINYIQTSLYSLVPQVHDSITGLKGSFEKTFNNIKLCIENDIPLQINCPIVKQNKGSFTEVLDWAKKHGIKANTDFYIMAQTDNSLENLKSAIKNNEVNQVYKTVLKNDKGLIVDIKNIVNKKQLPKINPEQHICGAGNNTLFISATGKVSPCATWQSYEIGDLNKKSLSDIYYNSNEINKLRDIKYKDFPDVNNSQYRPFIKVCPADNANKHKGDYTKVSQDIFDNAKLQYEAAKEFFKQ